MLRSLQRGGVTFHGRRALSIEAFMPNITDRRLEEGGPGGRSSNAGLRFAIFGATGFLGKHVCNQLGRWQNFLRKVDDFCEFRQSS